jgi:hypothetical protein
MGDTTIDDLLIELDNMIPSKPTAPLPVKALVINSACAEIKTKPKSLDTRLNKAPKVGKHRFQFVICLCFRKKMILIPCWLR